MHGNGIIIGVLGGLAIFLYGMKKMSESLQVVAGNEMKRILKILTNTPLRGVFVGAFVTSIIQSSSATTVMLVGFVNAGLMTLRQAIGVVMGANIGTTITAQIIAFKIGHYSYPIIILGVIMIFFKRSRRMELWGHVILGFGLLFMGLTIMSSTLKPLRHSELAKHFFVTLSHNPILGILAGTLVTVIIQSSSASIGLVIALANNGLIELQGAIYLVLGDNIGTTITAWLASLAADRASKRVALVHTMFNIIGATIFGVLTYLTIYPHFIDWLTPGAPNTEHIARHIANSHSVFNIINTLVFLPFVSVLEKIAMKALPFDGKEKELIGEPKYISENLLTTPELAIEQTIKEIKDMLRLSNIAYNKAIDGYLNKDKKLLKQVDEYENAIDHLQKELTFYIVKISEQSLKEDEYNKIPTLLHSINDIERIGDHSENLKEIFERILEHKIDYPDLNIQIKHVKELLNEMNENTLKYINTFQDINRFKVIEIEGKINQLQEDVKSNIISMLQSGKCDPIFAMNFTDFIDNVERIADHMKNIVKAASKDFEFKNIEKGKVFFVEQLDHPDKED